MPLCSAKKPSVIWASDEENMLQAAQPPAKGSIWLKRETWKPENNMTRSILFTSYILHVCNSPLYISTADTQRELTQIWSVSIYLKETGDMLSWRPTSSNHYQCKTAALMAKTHALFLVFWGDWLLILSATSLMCEPVIQHEPSPTRIQWMSSAQKRHLLPLSPHVGFSSCRRKCHMEETESCAIYQRQIRQQSANYYQQTDLSS